MNEGFYSQPVTKLKSLKKYFKRDDAKRTITFIGNTLEVRIPKRFETYRMLEVTDVIKALGIVDLIIDEKFQCCLNILGRITIVPSRYEDIVLDDIPYLVAHLNHGDIFIKDVNLEKADKVIYTVFCEFITRGKPIYTFSYDNLALVFDRVKQFASKGLGVDRSVFELVISHISRKQDDLFKQYRYTDMKEPPVFIDLNNFSLAPTTTSSRMMGSYFDDGLTASLLTTNKDSTPFENIIRGIPSDV